MDPFFLIFAAPFLLILLVIMVHEILLFRKNPVYRIIAYGGHYEVELRGIWYTFMSKRYANFPGSFATVEDAEIALNNLDHYSSRVISKGQIKEA